MTRLHPVEWLLLVVALAAATAAILDWYYEPDRVRMRAHRRQRADLRAALRDRRGARR